MMSDRSVILEMGKQCWDFHDTPGGRPLRMPNDLIIHVTEVKAFNYTRAATARRSFLAKTGSGGTHAGT